MGWKLSFWQLSGTSEVMWDWKIIVIENRYHRKITSCSSLTHILASGVRATENCAELCPDALNNAECAGHCQLKRHWTEYLIKVPLLFVQGCAGSICPLHINHEVLHLILQPLLCLLERSTFCVDSFHVFLSILQPLGQLLPRRGNMGKRGERSWAELAVSELILWRHTSWTFC